MPFSSHDILLSLLRKNHETSTLFWRIVLLFNPVEFLGLPCMERFECSVLEQTEDPVFRVLKTMHVVGKPCVENQLVIWLQFQNLKNFVQWRLAKLLLNGIFL